jgi:hypothetical protein
VLRIERLQPLPGRRLLQRSVSFHSDTSTNVTHFTVKFDLKN